MNGSPGDGGGQPPRQLHPLPKGLVELYGLLAVLFVLVPEWMAGRALTSLVSGASGAELPAPSRAWRRLPELLLASLSLAQLRDLGRRLHIRGYGRLDRQALTSALLIRLRRAAARGQGADAVIT
ncbi:MAG: hypothetical protein VKN13_05235 [Cyanobacteriota bacterium]|nr:hypothetical protein [Cyanobacteriota bacterium]